MHLTEERPDYSYILRGADGVSATVNDRVLRRSFIITPDVLLEDWPVLDVSAMQVADLEPFLALQPEFILLGSGQTQRFPPAAVLAACLSRGVGLETMTNAAAARTYTVVAAEGRKLAAGFVLSASS